MYIVENNSTLPQFNLALEEHLCALCQKSASDGLQFFMLWQNEPSIIVGRFQNTLEEVDAEYVQQHGIHVVRRNSGGGAVYHDLGNINYSFIVPDSGDFDFEIFGKPIIKALAVLGVKAEVSGRNDITIDGKKISGGAQFRRGGATLHHGTLLYDTDLNVLSKALRPAEDKFQSKAVKSTKSRVSNIKPYLQSPLSVHQFQEQLLSAIQADNKAMVPMVQDLIDWDEVQRLSREKYSAWEWNYGNSPRFTERKRMRFPWGGIEALLTIDEGIITSCTFFGDFFGSGNYASLMVRLGGTAYTAKAIAAALAGLDTNKMFAGSTPEDIVALLSPVV